MIYHPKTKVAVSLEMAIAVGATITTEGACLIADSTAGVGGVKLSTGATTDSFVGISISQEFPLTAYPKIEEIVQPVSHIIVLQRTPISGTVLVYDKNTSTALVLGTDYTISGATITLLAATDGHQQKVVYKFVPTVLEQRFIMGDIYPGGAAGTTIGQIGVLQSGVVYTTEYDTSANWAAANPVIKTGANGILTIGGSGTVVPAQVVSAPTVSQPFLGVKISAA